MLLWENYIFLFSYNYVFFIVPDNMKRPVCSKLFSPWHQLTSTLQQKNCSSGAHLQIILLCVTENHPFLYFVVLFCNTVYCFHENPLFKHSPVFSMNMLFAHQCQLERNMLSRSVPKRHKGKSEVLGFVKVKEKQTYLLILVFARRREKLLFCLNSTSDHALF